MDTTRTVITIELDPKTRKAFKVKTAQNGTTMQDVVEKAIQAYLKADRAKF